MVLPTPADSKGPPSLSQPFDRSARAPFHRPRQATTMAILTRAFDSLRSYLGGLTWGPFVALSRTAVLSQLSKIQVGQLVITDEEGALTICGAPGIKDGSPRTQLKVLKEAFWVRMVLFADMVSCGGPPRRGAPGELWLEIKG